MLKLSNSRTVLYAHTLGFLTKALVQSFIIFRHNACYPLNWPSG